jgi:hypothetical protein
VDRNKTSRNIVKHYRNRGRAEAEIVRENLQANGFVAGGLAFRVRSHRTSCSVAPRMMRITFWLHHRHILSNGLRLSKVPKHGGAAKPRWDPRGAFVFQQKMLRQTIV